MTELWARQGAILEQWRQVSLLQRLVRGTDLALLEAQEGQDWPAQIRLSHQRRHLVMRLLDAREALDALVSRSRRPRKRPDNISQ